MAPLSLHRRWRGKSGAMRPIAAGLALSVLLVAGCSGGTSSPSTQPPPPSATPSSTGTSRPAALNWPTYHGTNDRAGAAPSALRGKLRRAWSMQLDAAMYAQPIVAGGVVLAATENN